MREHSENSSKEFMSGSQDSLSKRQAVISSFMGIVFKEGITKVFLGCTLLLQILGYHKAQGLWSPNQI
jgi:hypothetical protein